jgi:hypothetical protein
MATNTSKSKATEGAPFEVLTEAPNGHRTVHRFRAASLADARSAVEAGLPHGSTVLDAAPAGSGLGSGDNDR